MDSPSPKKAYDFIIHNHESQIGKVKAIHVERCADQKHGSWPSGLLDWVNTQWGLNFENQRMGSIMNEYDGKVKQLKEKVTRNQGIGPTSCQLTADDYANIRSAVKNTEIEFDILSSCADCVLKSYEGIKFSTLCAVPHVAVWAKLHGHPFWPAKLLSLTKSDGPGPLSLKKQAFVWFFGPQQETGSVPLEKILFVSDPIRNPVKDPKSQSYQKAVKSLKQYVNNLKESDPRLQVFWPRKQNQYDGHTLTYTAASAPDQSAMSADDSGHVYDDDTDIESAPDCANERDDDDTEIDEMEQDGPESTSQQTVQQPSGNLAEIRKQQIRDKLEADKRKLREEHERQKENLKKQFDREICELQDNLDKLNRPLLVAAGRSVPRPHFT